MKNYTFLTQNSQEGPTTYYAVDPGKIEEMKISDTYDNYGQKVGVSDAGDYIELVTEKAVEIANKEYNEYHNYEDEEFVTKWSVGDLITAYDYSHEGFEAVTEFKELTEGVDYHYHALTCKGFTYWDGHNWKTITVEKEDFTETTHEIETDKTIVEALNKAIEEKEFHSEKFGEKRYSSEEYVVIDNYCQGTWESYKLIPADEFDMQIESERFNKRNEDLY